jgi:hypothetical protein
MTVAASATGHQHRDNDNRHRQPFRSHAISDRDQQKELVGPQPATVSQ